MAIPPESLITDSKFIDVGGMIGRVVDSSAKSQTSGEADVKEDPSRVTKPRPSPVSPRSPLNSSGSERPDVRAPSMSAADLQSALSLVENVYTELPDMTMLKLEQDDFLANQEAMRKNQMHEYARSSSSKSEALSAREYPSERSHRNLSSRYHSWSTSSSSCPPTPDQTATSHQSTPWSNGLPITPRTPDVFLTREAWTNSATTGQNRKPNHMEPVLGRVAQRPANATQTGRYLMISGFPRNTTRLQVQELIMRSGEVKNVIYDHLESKGYVVVILYDCREAFKLYRSFNSLDALIAEGLWAKLQCFPIEKQAVEKEMGVEMLIKAREDYLSEAVIVIRLKHTEGTPLAELEPILHSFGDVVEAVQLFSGEVVVEYFDSRHAKAATAGLHNVGTDHIYFDVREYSNDPFDHPAQGKVAVTTHSASKTLGSAAYRPGSFSYGDASDIVSPRSSWISPPAVPGRSKDHYQPSHMWPTTYNDTSYDMSDHSNHSLANKQPLYISRVKFTPGYDNHPYDLLNSTSASRALVSTMTRGIMNNMGSARAQMLRGHGPGGTWQLKARHKPSPGNEVIRERIVTGADQRTTVMVKDVPNKLSRDELVQILRRTVPGGFDFVYLRFDFVNGCNVGYAFVNFITTAALCHFVDQKVGKKWHLFSSEKVLQVSYADIQGKAALVAKFRNSEVMNKEESWRPQIFYSSGTMQGEPEPFPLVRTESTNVLYSSEPDHPHHRPSEAGASTSTIMRRPLDHARSPSIYDYEYAPKMFDSRF